tara:strand:- start:36 stop:485 length:450 start_codon:yes stop_codon:yes gene_type:complete
MVTFRNNSSTRRSNFRRNDRNFKSNGERQKFNSNFSNNDTFKRKAPGRNNHNAAKLIEKYNDLAREALSNGDKILSENYMQHADHFTRIFNEKENLRKEKFSEHRTENNSGSINENNNNFDEKSEKDLIETSSEEEKIQNKEKSQVKII